MKSPNSIGPTLGIVASVLAALGGLEWRRHVDSSPGGGLDLGSLVASKTPRDGSDGRRDPGELDFYREMTKLLKREYVDPITDDQKLVDGAIKGMVYSLGDPDCLYYDADQFKTVLKAKSGKYEGIGVKLALKMDSRESRDSLAPGADDSSSPELATKAPEIVVSAVAPGGPADRAGVRAGDVVSYVDGHWIMDGQTIDNFRKAQRDFGMNKITREQYGAIHKDLREKFEKSVMPLKAMRKLTSGTTGVVDIVWLRDGKTIETKLTKAEYDLEPDVASGDKIERLSFVSGASDWLRKTASGKKNLTIDLRNNADGDFKEMKQCLGALGVNGKAGYIANARSASSTPFEISSTETGGPKLTLIVDRSTAGAAEIFALALAEKGRAKIVGGPMSPNRSIVELYSLPDGAGYSLVTGRYATEPGKLQSRLEPNQPRVVTGPEEAEA